MTRLAAALCALAALACARGAPPAEGGAAPASAALAGDTARGTVEEVGAEPGTSFVLHAAGGSLVRLDGDRRLLGSVVGVEVAVHGRRDPRGVLRVQGLAVRASSGVPAVDGVLARDGAGWVLVTEDGRRHTVAHLPEPLRAKAGARVWLAGPLDRPPEAYGVIVDAR
ncbi:MAG: hypothetical protein JWM27_3791 [Gemmatimonadetes bacterium]|nr:hypothetical protein [Gemmatimonadota bacterium]